MTDNKPTVEVHTEPSSDGSEETVVTGRFTRKKVVKAAGTAAAVVGALALIFAGGKRAGKKELIEDVRNMDADPDQPVES